MAQGVATLTAMGFNYIVNNAMTYRDVRLRGVGFWKGLVLFCAICSIGGMANIGVAAFAYRSSDSWALAGLAGALIGAVFNFAMSSSLIWRSKPRRIQTFRATAGWRDGRAEPALLIHAGPRASDGPPRSSRAGGRRRRSAGPKIRHGCRSIHEEIA